MGDPLKKVRPGQPMDIPAATHNAMIDAARAHKALVAGGRGQPPPPRGSGILPVKNSSGSDRDRFDVLGIDGMIFDYGDNADEFKTNPAIDGITPATASHVGKFVILLEPIPDGRIGRGLLLGVSPVKVNVVNANDVHADVANGETAHLESGSSGAATILWKEAGTGVKWALVKVGIVNNGVVEFGKVVYPVSAGPKMTLDPCDWDGTDNGRPNVAVHLCSVFERIVREPIPAGTVVIWLRYASGAGEDPTDGVLLGIHQGTAVSPKIMGDAVNAAANILPSPYADSWDRASQGANDGVKDAVQRTGLYEPGDGTVQITFFYRVWLHDSAGHKLAKTVEAEIDTITVALQEP